MSSESRIAPCSVKRPASCGQRSWLMESMNPTCKASMGSPRSTMTYPPTMNRKAIWGARDAPRYGGPEGQERKPMA